MTSETPRDESGGSEMERLFQSEDGSAIAADRDPARQRFVRRRWLLAGAALVVVIILVAVVSMIVTAATAPSKIDAAVSYCGLTGNPYAAVADDGRSVALDTTGDAEVEGLDAADLVCVLVETDVSDDALEQMSSTVGAGPQSAEWNGMSATWEHRPDAGLNVTLTQK
ncbi:hypothetical protein [Herbiconiux liukaitaii]|uniref:hypothetical protein n=1 Tax=Herbiconiux liukaitaii TaxID=3342799 RepID=UPI0035B9FA02